MSELLMERDETLKLTAAGGITILAGVHSYLHGNEGFA